VKKKLAIQSLALTALMVSGGTMVGATAPVSEIPLEEGIVIDTSTGTVDATATSEVQETNAETTEEVKANDGTSLPLDQGEVNSTDVDSGGEVVEVQPSTATPQEDTVILAEKETPVVEPLAQTGISGKGVLYAGLALLLGAVAFLGTRFSKSSEV